MTRLLAACTSQWLNNKFNQTDKQFTGKVISNCGHSVLINFDGQSLIHITNKTGNLSPFSLLVNGFSVDELFIDSKVTRDNKLFILDNCYIQVPDDISIYNESLINILKHCDYQDPTDISVSTFYLEQFVTIRNEIMKSHVLNDRLNLVFNIIKLLGTGEGLTPSGDDYIVGFVYGLYNQKREDLITLLRDTIVESAERLTNTVSREFIYHALEGRFSQNIIEHNWTELMKFGHTSGYFTILGIADCINRHELVFLID